MQAWSRRCANKRVCLLLQGRTYESRPISRRFLAPRAIGLLIHPGDLPCLPTAWVPEPRRHVGKDRARQKRQRSGRIPIACEQPVGQRSRSRRRERRRRAAPTAWQCNVRLFDEVVAGRIVPAPDRSLPHADPTPAGSSRSIVDRSVQGQESETQNRSQETVDKIDRIDLDKKSSDEKKLADSRSNPGFGATPVPPLQTIQRPALAWRLSADASHARTYRIMDGDRIRLRYALDRARLRAYICGVYT
jgi:hypothetical protein